MARMVVVDFAVANVLEDFHLRPNEKRSTKKSERSLRVDYLGTPVSEQEKFQNKYDMNQLKSYAAIARSNLKDHGIDVSENSVRSAVLQKIVGNRKNIESSKYRLIENDAKIQKSVSGSETSVAKADLEKRDTLKVEHGLNQCLKSNVLNIWKSMISSLLLIQGSQIVQRLETCSFQRKICGLRLMVLTEKNERNG